MPGKAPAERAAEKRANDTLYKGIVKQQQQYEKKVSFFYGDTMKVFLCLLLLLSLAGLRGEESSSELRMVKKELLLKQQELERLTGLLAQKESELRKIRIWMSNLSADSRQTTVSEREERLLHGLKILSDASNSMVLKTMELADLLRPRLNALPLASADRVRLVMALEDLERSAARVNAIADGAGAKEDKLLENVRISAVNSQLNMAVLSAGSLQGIFPGMTFVTSDGKVWLRILETRAAISGAVPVAGSLDQLTPGMSVKLEIIKKPPTALPEVKRKGSR